MKKISLKTHHMGYRNQGLKTDLITLLNNFHNKRFSAYPDFSYENQGKLKIVIVRTNWGEYKGSNKNKSVAKEEAVKAALAEKPV